MEDCCVVCAEPLEWIAYGPCGHKDVCSTCIVRLRFVLNDKKCCICKQECHCVFVTRALGDYTHVVSDFEALSIQNDNNKGGKQHWHDSNIEAYFDDEDHFKMIKSMCRLYCHICEQTEYSDRNGYVKKGYNYRDLVLLRGHIFRDHGFHMCGLCLEGRKIFICEQKLYTREQLDCHLSTGDSEVDGKEGETGFRGHPMCDFCRERFYGDNELFQHMTREHFTCHICQRLHPELSDYYQNYDDLEAHFRHEHHLCEDEECLAKKFVVFPSEAELKRHNALVHGGNMSRAQRSAALRVPVSFQYHRAHQEHRNAGISRQFSRDRGAVSDSSLLQAMHASIDTAILESTIRETASRRERIEPYGFASDFPSCENGAITRSTNPSRCLNTVNASVPSTLEESAFPPLPGSSRNARRKLKQHAQSSAVSMASRLRTRHGSLRVINSQDNSHSRMDESQLSASLYASEATPVQRNISFKSKLANNRKPRSMITGFESQSSSSSRLHGEASAVPIAVRSSTEEEGNNRSSNSRDGVRFANKVLIEHIRIGLKDDKQLFSSFKDISSQFRHDKIDAKAYCKHIASFGLTHLITELAGICPDPRKREDLLDAYSEELREAENQLCVARGIRDVGKSVMDMSKEDISAETSSAELELKKDVRKTEEFCKHVHRNLKGKAKLPISNGACSSSDVAGDENEPTLVLNRASEAYLSTDETSTMTSLNDVWSCGSCTLENKVDSKQCAACGMDRPGKKPVNMQDRTEDEKQKKKVSKFQKVRLGDGSASDLVEPRNNLWGVESRKETSNCLPTGGKSFGRGVWNNAGGQKLVLKAQKDSLVDSLWTRKK